MDFPGADGLDHFRVAVVEEGTLLAVQGCHRLHVLRTQLEVEDGEVLGHALLAHGLGDGHHAALRQPAQDHLRHALAVLPGHRLQGLVVEEVILALGERPPRLDLDVVFLEELLGLSLLVEGVRLDLVDGGHDFVVHEEIHEPVGIEITHPDGLDAARLVKLLHRPPGAVHVAERLVDQVQVEVVELELVQRRLESRLGPFVAGVLHPEFGGDEEFFARDATFLNGFTYRLLVAVGRRRVEQSVACLDGVQDAALALGEVGHLEDPEAEDGHLEPVVQGDGWDR